MVKVSIPKQGTSQQINIARVLALGVAAISAASANDKAIEALPQGTALRRALERYREACRASPRLSAVRALSSTLTLLWAHSVKIHNVSIVDIYWALSFVISGVAYASHEAAAKAFSGRKALVLALTTAWAGRLSTYLWWRNHVSEHGIGAGGHLEDFRYQRFRAYWDKQGLSYWWFSLFQVFGLQGLLSFTVSAPLHAAATREQPQHFTLLDFAGAASFAIGYVFEHAGDLELTAFKSNPANKGSTLARGLWSHTRHPNYFGNACMWWGLYLIACATKGGWKSFYGPAVMTYLLTNVSGAKLLEKSLSRNKAGFSRYQEAVPEFVPWGLLGLK